MSSADLQNHIENSIWKSGAFTTLLKSINPVGDVRVYALQIALKKLSYYSGKLDGNYGSGTTATVKSYQRAVGLTADGKAGSSIQPKLYDQASGSTTSDSSGTTEAATETNATADNICFQKPFFTFSAKKAMIQRYE